MAKVSSSGNYKTYLINKERKEAHLKSAKNLVIETIIKEPSEWTKILRYFTQYKGPSNFTRSIGKQINKYGINSLSEKQKEIMKKIYNKKKGSK